MNTAVPIEQLVAARPVRARPKVVVDLFCGAGSLSAGARDALVSLGHTSEFHAVNHSDVATKTFALNHPEARVHCVTLDEAYPRAIVPGGIVDLLMGGIECTFFSRARGGRPINDQQRMSAWHIVRWCTELKVKRCLLENVPEFVKWGPVDHASGKAIKSREGEYFGAFVQALRAIGGSVDHRVVNCADFGDATTRVRLLIQVRFDGKPITWPSPSHGRHGGRGAGVPRWRPARECIDWSKKGTSIFDRKRPLAPKTLARIAAGIVKFNWPEPFLVVLRQHADARGLDLPLPAVCAGGTHIGLAQPFTIGNRENNTGKPIDGPIAGATTAAGGGIALVEPFVFPLNQGLERNRGHRGVSDPMCTITASGTDLGVVEPFIATVAHGNQAHERDPDSRRCRSPDDPLQTIHAGGGKFAIVEPFILSQASGGAPRAAADPVPTIPAGGAHALIAPYYGSGSGETCSSVDQPLPTATAKARFGVVFPVTHHDASNRARSTEEPLPTLTTASRGELAFITASFGERATQTPRVHSAEEPVPTICATGHTNLVAAGRDYDILFRMLNEDELAAAMSISTPERPYVFTGNKTQVIRQIGQAVPRRTAEAHVREIMRT